MLQQLYSGAAWRLAVAAAVYVPPAVGCWPLCTAPVASTAILRGDSAEQKEFQAKDEVQTARKKKGAASLLTKLEDQLSLDMKAHLVNYQRKSNLGNNPGHETQRIKLV